MAQKNTQHVAALLTGRGGSSLKDKNILPIMGKPLLSYPAQAALESTLITDYYVSSDDNKILDTAAHLGYNTIKRPAELASDTAQHIDAILHGLKVMAEDGVQPDILVVLLANSVVIKTEWIDICIQELLNDETITTAAPVYEDSDHHPYRAKRINSQGLVEPFFDFSGKKISTNRQDLDSSYFFCHNFWVLRTKSLENPEGQKPWTFMGSRIKPYLIHCGFIDVHERSDLQKSEDWLREQQ